MVSFFFFFFFFFGMRVNIYDSYNNILIIGCLKMVTWQVLITFATELILRQDA